MPTFPLDESAGFPAEEGGDLSPISAPPVACSPVEPSHHAEERERRPEVRCGERGRVMLVGALTFQPLKISCVG